ncbi:FAD-dependent monooxygenase [Yinghuangia aomiensis]
MRVVVAGGGIGGLTAALSLHAAGITDVAVLEAAPELRPLGVGVNVLPHAVRELTELGLAERLSGQGVATAALAYHSRHGQAIWSEAARRRRRASTWPRYSVHRGTLRMMLFDAVNERLGTESVRTGSVVTAFEGHPGRRPGQARRRPHRRGRRAHCRGRHTLRGPRPAVPRRGRAPVERTGPVARHDPRPRARVPRRPPR